MKKATNNGTCQICDRVQKLPGGLLSKHGYTVEYGFFNGVCPGAEALPYELSCDLIPPVIENLKQQAAGVRRFATELRQEPTEPKGWHHSYEGTRIRGYVWVKADIVEDEVINGRTYFAIVPTEGEYKGKRIPTIRHSLHGATALEIAKKMNERRAEACDRHAASIDEFVERLQKKVDNWTVKPLLPLK